ncbi:hypothetical protein AQUCO_00201033v1 [Aquilegia coerulea]|uniref:Uncharacterized protein n=1 Tax=Aquilegia coerulea TaxID=218851 RepID=A0A2G5F5V5_AQUCA|nr:hypothetical protein AQUCO_00201033v1 [Aquilegia coerulea]
MSGLNPFERSNLIKDFCKFEELWKTSLKREHNFSRTYSYGFCEDDKMIRKSSPRCLTLTNPIYHIFKST